MGRVTVRVGVTLPLTVVLSVAIPLSLPIAIHRYIPTAVCEWCVCVWQCVWCVCAYDREMMEGFRGATSII